MSPTRSNHPAAGKAEIARVLMIERNRLGLPEPGRYPAQATPILLR
jgi:hypothetical protein